MPLTDGRMLAHSVFALWIVRSKTCARISDTFLSKTGQNQPSHHRYPRNSPDMVSRSEQRLLEGLVHVSYKTLVEEVETD